MTLPTTDTEPWSLGPACHLVKEYLSPSQAQYVLSCSASARGVNDPQAYPQLSDSSGEGEGLESFSPMLIVVERKGVYMDQLPNQLLGI